MEGMIVINQLGPAQPVAPVDAVWPGAAAGVLDALPCGVLLFDADLQLLASNRAAHRLCQWPGAGGSGQPLAQLLPLAEVLAAAQALLAGAAPPAVLCTLGAQCLRVELQDAPAALAGARLLLTVTDASPAPSRCQEVCAPAAHYRNQAALLDQASDAIIVRDCHDRIVFWNRGAQRLYGWSADEVAALSVDAIYDDPRVLQQINSKLRACGAWRGELTQRHQNGSRFPVESQRTLVRTEDQRSYSTFIINTDITQRKEHERSIQRLALFDSMTGLPNRRHFMEHMRQAIGYSKGHANTLALLFVDLNRFKEINDTRGHQVGDLVLVEVARRFETVLHAKEMLARLAGDEFVVLAEAGNSAAAGQLAQRLLATLAEPVLVDGQAFPLSASVGSTLFPADGGSVEVLLKHADLAMYRAKAQGGGYQPYRSEMSAGLHQRIELAQRLRLAIDAGALALHYQPKHNLATGGVNGAEALLRWRDAVCGEISPANFIPMAEARGMMGALGTWVLRAACRQLCDWRAAGLHFPGRLAVNLAAQQLAEPDAAEAILAIVDEAGLRPDCFELELTESGLMGNVEQAIGVMAKLRAAGFTLSVDDFGTGYSSLAYLKRLPVNTLKIDISFVRDMLSDSLDHTIVATIIGMARNLQMRTVAEGVETLAQAEALRALGCDDAQGYYFGRPQPAALFARQCLGA